MGQTGQRGLHDVISDPIDAFGGELAVSRKIEQAEGDRAGNPKEGRARRYSHRKQAQLLAVLQARSDLLQQVFDSAVAQQDGVFEDLIVGAFGAPHLLLQQARCDGVGALGHHREVLANQTTEHLLGGRLAAHLQRFVEEGVAPVGNVVSARAEAAQHGSIELLLAPKVVVHATVAHAGFGRDLTDRDLVETLLGEEFRRGMQQLFFGLSVAGDLGFGPGAGAVGGGVGLVHGLYLDELSGDFVQVDCPNGQSLRKASLSADFARLLDLDADWARISCGSSLPRSPLAGRELRRLKCDNPPAINALPVRNEAMPLLRFLALAVLLAALGGAGYYLLRQTDGDSSESLEGDVTSGLTLEEADLGPSADLEGVTLEGREELAADPTSRESIASRRIEKQQAEASVESLPDAEHYRGYVVDEYGAPVVGAQVEIGRLAPQEKLEARFSFSTKPISYQAVTGKDGKFSVPIKEPLGLKLDFHVAMRGYQVAKGERAIEGLHVGDLGTFVLEPGVVIEGRVIDETGGPVADAEVYRVAVTTNRNDGARVAMAAMGIGARPGSVQTDRDGRFEMPNEAPGTIELAVDHPRYLPTSLTREVSSREMISQWTLQVEQAGTIQGRLLGYPKGRTGVRVAARQVEGERIQEASADQGGFGRMIKAFMSQAGEFGADVEPDGSFTIIGLPKQGKFEVRAFEPDNWVEQRFLTPMVEAFSGDMSLVLPYDNGAQVSFEVVDAVTKKPIREFTVKASWPNEGQRLFFSPSSDKRVERHKDGKVTLYEVRPPKDPDLLTVRIQSPGYFDGWITNMTVGQGRKTDAGLIALQPAPVQKFLVLDAKTRKPVRRARVSIVGHSAGMALAMEDEADDLEGEVLAEDSAKNHKRSTNRTDKEGRCELSLFRAEAATLKVSARGYAAYQEDNFPLADNPSEHTVYLSQGATIHFEVLDEEGVAVGNAVIAAKDRKPFRWMGVEENGRKSRTRVPPGTYSFRASRMGRNARGGRGGWRMEGNDEGAVWTEVTVKGGETYDVVLTVPALSQVTGQVLAAGDPLVGARVAVAWVSENEPSDAIYEIMDAAGGQYGSNAETDAAGKFLLRDVKPGYYRLRVRHPDFAMSHQQVVHVLDRGADVKVFMPMTGVAGLVTDPNGKPVVGAKVYAEYAPQDGEEPDNNWEARFGRLLFGGQMPHVLTDGRGEYLLRGATPGRPLRVRAEAAGYVDKRSEVFQIATDQVRTDTNLRLQAAGALLVRAMSQEPISGMLFVTAEYRGEDQAQPDGEITFLEGGQTTLENLQPGPWDVTLTRRRMGPRSEREVLNTQRVEVVANETASTAFDLDQP